VPQLREGWVTSLQPELGDLILPQFVGIVFTVTVPAAVLALGISMTIHC